MPAKHRAMLDSSSVTRQRIGCHHSFIWAPWGEE